MLPTLICRPCFGLTDHNSDEILNYKAEPVFLNVYDMYKLNDLTSNIGLGVFHSGVEVYGTEYGYGGHQYPFSGIFDIEPKNVQALSEFFNMKDQLQYRETILIGYTTFKREEIELIKNRLSHKFQGNKYNLIHNNCNHFSAAFIKILCKKSIPGWINRLANVGSFIPFIQKILPRDWLHHEEATYTT